jgi:hypothetical protein
MKTTTTLAVSLLAVLCAHGQNLVLNGDFEAGNTNFSTDYRYSPGYMTPKGVYCVVTNPATVHGFWSSFGDHTAGSGLMLVANGDSNPTNTVWRQAVGVGTNMVYLFSAWAANAYPVNPSQFFFFVNGQQQGNVVTLPAATGLWQNYSVIWSSGGVSSALLEIRMLTTENEGNDFALDDLSFRAVTVTGTLPRLSIRPVAGQAAVELSWPSMLGQLYQVQWTSGLETNQWFSLGSPVAGNGTTNAIDDPLADNRKRFYRVIVVN